MKAWQIVFSFIIIFFFACKKPYINSRTEEDFKLVTVKTKTALYKNEPIYNSDKPLRWLVPSETLKVIYILQNSNWVKVIAKRNTRGWVLKNSLLLNEKDFFQDFDSTNCISPIFLPEK